MSERIRQRTDIKTRDFVNAVNDEFDYADKEDLMISDAAWRHVRDSNIRPHQVFAHPVLLQKHPKVSLYYRGLALLSLKRVRRVADVKGWEDGSRTKPVPQARALAACRLYNGVISSIIEGTNEWTLENGYRNILGNLGITLDGMFRNVIGKDAEQLIRTKITDWLRAKDLVVESAGSTTFTLPEGIVMVYGSEPDILFERDAKHLATIEIKGGRDPAGALERLGAMQKSFSETPAQCQNILIAGVVTTEMKLRLNEMAVKVYVLDRLLDDDGWDDFTKELFHYTLRII